MGKNNLLLQVMSFGQSSFLLLIKVRAGYLVRSLLLEQGKKIHQVCSFFLGAGLEEAFAGEHAPEGCDGEHSCGAGRPHVEGAVSDIGALAGGKAEGLSGK